MLEVRNLRKQFGKRIAVNNVSFQVHQGDAFGLLGPNGAGKSTTISLIAGLLSADGGEVSLHGHTLSKNPRYVKQRIGLVPQSIALYEELTARENLEFWGTIYGVTGSRLKDNVNWCLEVAGLKDHARQVVSKFSGGMKRRLNIAVGMIHRPELLIMDEPTVGIDPQSRKHILETVKRLNREGMTVIYTSHYMEEVQYLCTRLAIMDHGQMIAYGDLDDVRQLAGSLTTVHMEVSGDPTSVVDELRRDMAFKAVQCTGSTVVFQCTDAGQGVSRAVASLSRYGLQPVRIEIEEPNLETAFLHLTGRQLRDAGEGVSA
jgi:ABC-2 type transport system ATP-binding protein